MKSAALDLQQQLQAQPDWQQRFKLLLLAAKGGPVLTPAQRSDELMVAGCEATVWLQVTGQAHALTYHFASDARLIQALLNLTLLPVQQQSYEQLMSYDEQAFLHSCQLGHQLSPSRTNGLHQLMLAARQQASKLVTTG